MAKEAKKFWFRLYGWPIDSEDENVNRFRRYFNARGYLHYDSSKEQALRQYNGLATIARITSYSYKVGLNKAMAEDEAYADWIGAPKGDGILPVAEKRRDGPAPRVAIPGEKIALDYLRDYNGNFGFLLDLKEKARHFRLSAKQVDAVLRCMDRDKSAVSIREPKPKPDPVGEGWYEMDGTVYKVKKAVHGSGRLYALGLIDGNWTYAPGIAGRLKEDNRLSLERAQELGRLYGWCIVCGKTLTDEGSIAAGIGPICRKKFA